MTTGSRGLLSGDDGLQSKNGAGGNHYWINCALRWTAMTAQFILAGPHRREGGKGDAASLAMHHPGK